MVNKVNNLSYANGVKSKGITNPLKTKKRSKAINNAYSEVIRSNWKFLGIPPRLETKHKKSCLSILLLKEI